MTDPTTHPLTPPLTEPGLPADDPAGKSPCAVFVYGTLLRGQSRDGVWQHHRLRRALLAHTPGRLHATHDDYPVMSLGDASGRVHGDLIEPEDLQRLLPELDAIEEYDPTRARGNLFVRVIVPVQVGPRWERAWAYVGGDTLTPGPVIASGDWRAHQGGRRGFMQALAAHYRAAGAADPWSPDLSLAQALDQGRLDEAVLVQRLGAPVFVPPAGLDRRP